MERVKGIEPSSLAWEAKALPLSYTRPGLRADWHSHAVAVNHPTLAAKENGAVPEGTTPPALA